MRASDCPRQAAGPGCAARLGSGGGRGRRRGVAGRCGTRRAPRWSGLRRVRAGGDEAGGCGRSAVGARGRGRRARRALSRRAWAGEPAQLCFRRPASPVRSAAVPGARALCLRALPPATLPPALCSAALGARWKPLRAPHPVCISTSLSFLPCPFVVSLSSVAGVTQAPDSCPSFFHCLSPLSLLTFFCLVLSHPQRLCLPYLVAHSPSIPFLSRHCLLDLSTAHCVC